MMAESWLLEPPVVARAQRLFTIGSVTPLAIFLTVTIVMVLGVEPGNPYSTVDSYKFLAITGAIVVLIITWLTHWGSRNTPDNWVFATAFPGIWITFLFSAVTFGSPEERRFGPEEPAFSVAAGVLTLGILLLSWFPARRGARLVMDDLPPDVVDSSLIIRFFARSGDNVVLSVAPDSLRISRPSSSRKAIRSYPLTDVSAIAVRTEENLGEHPVPGATDKSIRVKPGEVVVFDVPGGQLVFPAKDAQKIRRFVEERRAALVSE